MKKVRWPLKSEMVKYSIATLSFIIFFGIFFTLGNLKIAGLKMSIKKKKKNGTLLTPIQVMKQK